MRFPFALPAITRFLCVLSVLCGVSLSSFALDREAFTITKYDLEIRLEPAQQRLGARGKITLRNDSIQPQKIAALQISSSLNWSAIRVNNDPVQFVSQPFTSDIDHTGVLSEAIVTLPAAINPKDSVEIEIGYEGVIPLDATRLARVGVPDAIARHTSWDHIGASFTAVRGAGYVTWYPITTESADFSEGNSLFEVTNRLRAREAGSAFHVSLHAGEVTDKEPPVLLCGGEVDSYSAEFSRIHAELANCSWKALGAVTPIFVLANYRTQSKPPLNLFSFPDHDRGAKTYADALDPAANFVTGWFGKPIAPISIADFADPHAAPYESGTLLMASMEDADTKLAGINLVHELVHSALPSPQPWVYEGLAHFAEAAYREQQGGREAALALLGIHRAAFLDAEKDIAAAPEKNPGQPLATTFDEIYYRSKAAYVWWMLRDMVGADALKSAIAKYRAASKAPDNKADANKSDASKAGNKAEDSKPGNVNDPRYIETLIEAASGRDLTRFFDDWVYHDRGLPDFRVQSVHPWKTENHTQIITVTLENLGPAGAEVPFTVRCQGSDVSRRIEVRAKSTATIRVELTSEPLEVVVNDGSVPESDLTNNVFQIPPNATDQNENVPNKPDSNTPAPDKPDPDKPQPNLGEAK